MEKLVSVIIDNDICISYNKGKNNFSLHGGSMIIAKVTSKGQITIPKEIRQKLGICPGEEVGFEEKDNRIVISKAFSKSPFDKWMGKLKHLKGKRSDDLIRETRGDDNGG